MCTATGGPTSNSFSTAPSGSLATIVGTHPSSVADANPRRWQQTHELIPQTLPTCAECKMQFSGERQLTWHVRALHGGKLVPCPQCSRAFRHRKGLQEHMKCVHENLPNYQCQVCQKGFTVRSHFLDHVAAHTGAKRNVCRICQAQFTFKRGLKAHIDRFHPLEVGNRDAAF